MRLDTFYRENIMSIKYLVLLSTQNVPILINRYDIKEEDEHIVQLNLVCTLDMVGILRLYMSMIRTPIPTEAVGQHAIQLHGR